MDLRSNVYCQNAPPKERALASNNHNIWYCYIALMLTNILTFEGYVSSDDLRNLLERINVTQFQVPDMDSWIAKFTVAYIATKVVEPLRLILSVLMVLAIKRGGKRGTDCSGGELQSLVDETNIELKPPLEYIALQGIPGMEQSLPSDTAELSNTLEEYKQRRCKLQNVNDISLYGILELEPTCAQSDVRKAYYHFSRILHPDKCQDHSAASLLNDVQMAYTILSDDYKRVLYDIKNGFSTGDQLQAQMSALQQGLKERYMQFLNERQMNYIASVGQEYRLRGLVIQKAIYGDLSLKEPNKLVSMETITEQHLKGPFIDVTVQLQLLCARGTLNVNSGGPMSYAFLPGFYNPLEITTSDLMPCFEVDAQLYVLYLFKGDVHEVTISDGTPFKLPMRTHRVYGSYIKGPYADGNIAVLVHGDSTH